jgi:multidrug efflux pump subunit AcrA (membrane-fusion protein)
MHPIPTVSSLQPAKKSPRAAAGKALLVFFLLMAAFTFANSALNELSIAKVDTLSPQRGALEKIVSSSGQLSASQVVPVYAEAAVHVETVPIRAGQQVTKGQPLFTLESKALNDLLADAQKALDEAQQTLKDAQQALAYAKADMRESALDDYADAQKDVDTAQAAYDKAVSESASKNTIAHRLDVLNDAIRDRDRMASVRSYFEKQAAVDDAGKALAEAQNDFDDATRIAGDPTVYAPCDGQVISVSIEAGGAASTASAALMLAKREGSLDLVVSISSDDTQELSIGDTAVITLSNKTYEAPILSIAPSAQDAGKYELSFQLPADAGNAGMNADVEIRKRTQNFDLLIPLSALHQDNTSYFVYVVAQKEGALGAETTVDRVDVSIIDQDSTRAAVQGGAGLRDEIVTRSDRDLSDGDRVRVEED